MPATFTRLVPLGGALQAAAARIEQPPGREPDPFLDWFSVERLDHPRGVSEIAAATPKQVEMILATGIPDTPAGRAWTAEARDALARTLDDSWRPYDRAEIIDDPYLDALAVLAEVCEEYSPMTACLADGLNRMTSPEYATIGSYRAMFDAITPDGFVIRPAAVDGDGYPYRAAEIALWRHVAALVPEFRARVTELATAFVASLPEVAEDDRQAFRRGPWA